MWNHVKEFEQTIADYAGSLYAVAVDCCTNAIFITAKYLSEEGWNKPQVTLPKRTYVSVAQSLWQAGYNLRFDDIEWEGLYRIKPFNLIDSACRFTKDMYIPGSYQCLSFHHRKILSTVRGGMILTNDAKFVEWVRPMIYMGRDWDKKYEEDTPIVGGYNMYMTPEQAIEGLKKFKELPEHNEDLAGYSDYTDISTLNWMHTIHD